jgi:ATP-dependent RNA helicase RhlB
MSPTRELAVQIEEEAKKLGKYLPFKTGSFYGGVGYGQQLAMLRNDAQVLVGTPGRVIDLNQSGQMNLMDTGFLVLDEADRMFDMGFYPDLRKLIQVVPPADRRQTMLFSATLNVQVKNLAWEYTKAPFEIEIEPETITVDMVDQVLYHVPSENKMRLLLGIFEREQPERAIVFCNTKRYTEIVAKRLNMNGYKAEFIIGDLPQTKRLKIIEDVKAGKIRYLVATDVAARGLDVESLAMVVNYDLPIETENYVHRIGRTARAGKTGKAITLASEQDVYELADIERYIEKKIPSEIAGEDLYAEDKSARFGNRGENRKREGRREDGVGDRRRNYREDNNREKNREKNRENSGEERRNGGSRKAAGDNRGQRDGNWRAVGDYREQAADGVDLSKLSFEERMAYYKQKYNDDTARTASRQGKQRHERYNRRERPDASGRQDAADQETGRPAQDGAEQLAGGRESGQRDGRQAEPRGERRFGQQGRKGAPNGGGEAADGKFVGGKFADDKPISDKSTAGKPSDGKSGGGKPSDGKAASGKRGARGRGKSGGGKFADGKPASQAGGKASSAASAKNAATAAGETPAKKGFFAKLKGLFGRKDNA